MTNPGMTTFSPTASIPALNNNSNNNCTTGDRAGNVTYWILLGVFLFLAATAVPFCTFVARGLLNALKRNAKVTTLLRPFVNQCLAPVQFLLVILYVQLAYVFAPWPCFLDILRNVLGIVIFICALAGCWFLVYRLFTFIDIALPLTFKDERQKFFVRSCTEALRITKIVVLLALAIIFVAETFKKIGANITFEILAQLNLITMPLWLAVTFILRELAGGVQYFFDHPYDEGDFIEVDGTRGEVESVGLFSTSVRTFQGQHILVPMSRIVEGVITIYRKADFRIVAFDLPLPEDVSLQDSQSTRYIVRTVERTLAGNEYRLLNVSFGDSTQPYLRVQFLVSMSTLVSPFDVHVAQVSAAIRDCIDTLKLGGRGSAIPIQGGETLRLAQQRLQASKASSSLDDDHAWGDER